jgi:hypothetical protein
MASDLGLLRTWVKEEYACPAWKSDIPFDEIIQTLIQTAYSDFAQVFTGVRAGEPLCEVQVFHASQDDELGSSLLVEEGDYVLRLMPGKGMPSQHRAVVETCVEYFMQYTEVKRVLAVVDEENASGNAVFRKAGFSLLTILPSSYKMNNLYVYP